VAPMTTGSKPAPLWKDLPESLMDGAPTKPMRWATARLIQNALAFWPKSSANLLVKFLACLVQRPSR
jgi:hypothetical protein